MTVFSVHARSAFSLASLSVVLRRCESASGPYQKLNSEPQAEPSASFRELSKRRIDLELIALSVSGYQAISHQLHDHRCILLAACSEAPADGLAMLHADLLPLWLGAD